MFCQAIYYFKQVLFAGVRKQSVEDVEWPFSKTLVAWMEKKGCDFEARHLSVVRNWRQACDERGLPSSLRSQFNGNFLEYMFEVKCVYILTQSKWTFRINLSSMALCISSSISCTTSNSFPSTIDYCFGVCWIMRLLYQFNWYNYSPHAFSFVLKPVSLDIHAPLKCHYTWIPLNEW